MYSNIVYTLNNAIMKWSVIDLSRRIKGKEIFILVVLSDIHIWNEIHFLLRVVLDYSQVLIHSTTLFVI